MGTSNLKKLQLIALLGLTAFVALGFTIVQRGFTELSKLGATLRVTGPQAKQTRSLSNFDRIEAGSIFEVDVTFGTTPSVVLEAPRDLLPHLTSRVHGSTLSLECDRNFSMTGDSHVRAHVVTRHLRGATISGAGRMIVRGKIQEPSFDAFASGAATLTLAANVDSFRLEASGAAKAQITSLGAHTMQVEASGAANCTVNGSVDSSSITASGGSNVQGRLTSGRANVQTSGAAHASLRVLNSLTGEASGASSISYSGRPSNVSTQTSGVGSINRRN